MKKNYLSLILCLVFPFLVPAQANKWISYGSNPYYKIKVVKDGIYRIDSLTLANAGIPVASIPPQNFQLYYRGKQQYIFVKDQSTGRFGGSKSGNDYIEFYGRHNSGALDSDAVSDSLLYTCVNPTPNNYIKAVPNPYYSMFNDTATYFLTWSNSSAGLRMTSYAANTSFSGNIPQQYFMYDTVIYGTAANNNYFAGARTDIVPGESVNDPRYTSTEGWFLPAIPWGGSLPPFNLGRSSYVFGGGPMATIKTFFEGQTIETPMPSNGIDHEVRVTGSWKIGLLTDTSFYGFVPCVETYQATPAQLKVSTGMSITFTNVGISSASPGSDYVAPSYIFFQYPHTTNLQGLPNFMMYVRDTSSRSNTYLNLTNFSSAPSDSVRLYDLANHNRYIVTDSSGIYKVLMANIPGAIRQCYMTADAQVNHVAKLIPVGTSPFDLPGQFTNFNGPYNTPYIIIYHPSLQSEAEAYYTYRQKKYGSDVILANIEELYDQFGYGIEKDPMAIRNFCSYILSKTKKQPAGLFLMGKAMYADAYRANNNLYDSTLVPSFGNPPSDVLLTAGLTSASFDLHPVFPTGRLAAVNNLQVSNYLSKVITYENTVPALWQKNIIHFSGGANAVEQAFLLSSLRGDSAIAADTSFGAYVYTFQKTTTAPIQVTVSDSVTNIINSGVSLMTFFGHASGNNFDINLDAPSDYNNVGKYPMILALACFSGDIFQPQSSTVSSTSEQFVLDTKGSIGFVAMDDVAEEVRLSIYAGHLYSDFSSQYFGQPFAKCMQQAVIQTEGSGSDLFTDYMLLEMQLHGDPGIAINGQDVAPDYAVTDSTLTFIPNSVTTQMDTFQVKLSVINNAKAVNQKVPIVIGRQFPDDTTKTMLINLWNIYNRRDTIIKFPVNKTSGQGLNQFSVQIDPGASLKPAEITRANNNLSGVNLFITSGDIIPIYPYSFAIIPKDTATLKASTGDPFASAHNYIFQIDTTIYFNSPFLKTQVVNAKGGVVRAPWNKWVNTPLAPPIYPTTLKGSVAVHFKDSTVYYWRVRRDTSDIKDFGWQGLSFQYITGKTGWGQSHYYQFDNNDYTYMEQQPKSRDWVFDPTGKTLTCTTYGIPITGPWNNNASYETGYYLDLNVESYNSCQPIPGLCLAVIDPVSLTPWVNSVHNLGFDNTSANSCTYPDTKFLYWYNDKTAQKALEKAIEDSIPNGYYVLIYSFMESMSHSWADTSLLTTLIKMGASPSLRTSPGNTPLIIFGKKGGSFITKTGGTDSLAVLTLTQNLINNEYYGSMQTPEIGPAQKWDSISWRQHPFVKTAVDSVRLNINAINQYGVSSTLLKGVTPAVANIYIKSLSATQYPYLQMSLYTKDAITHTPSQMNKWQVFYTPVPEVALNPSIYTSFYKDTLYGGDTVRLKTVVQNVGDYPMDSMFVNSWIVDPNGASHSLAAAPLKHTKRLNPGDTAMISAKSSTFGYAGVNNLWIEANPLGQTITRPEEYHFNNLARKTFVASADKNKPLMDVTFDGIHILNNDIVSPHPSIVIEVTSNNKYLALNYLDTGNIAVYVRNVNTSTSQRIYFCPSSGTCNNQLQFTPAVLPGNTCKILYTPTYTDGTYELTVQAADRSGNLSATNTYKIDFEVITKSSITNVLNYPNPFSTSTRFVFTLTGEQLPTYFKIQIMTITGKVVREITEGELGPIHIGRNITEYAWDGTDQFGDKLANGVYLYRVVSSISGQAIDHLQTDADSYFTKGWGKMYLIR